MSTSELALSDVGQAKLRLLIERDGLASSAGKVGVARETLARMASGIPTRRGSVLIVASALEVVTPPLPGKTKRIAASAMRAAPGPTIPEAARAFLARTLTTEQRAGFERQSGISLKEPTK